MTNKITLFKSPFPMSGVEQPYFMRDTFPNNMADSGIVVNVQNPNIHFMDGMNINITVNKDFSEVFDFNMARIEYNGKKYFVHITDYVQVSYGYTQLICRRALLYERPNFLSMFTHFNISRMSLFDGKAYGRNNKFYVPQFRQYMKSKNLEPYIKSFQATEVSEEEGKAVEFFPFIFIFTDIKPKDSPIPDAPLENFYGVSKDYNCIIIPFMNFHPRQSKKFYYYYIDNSLNPTALPKKKSIEWSESSYSWLPIYFKAYAAYIKSVKLCFLPCVKETDGLTLPYYYYETTSWEFPTLGTYTMFLLRSTNWRDKANYFTVEYAVENPYGDIEFNFLTNDASWKCQKSDYLSELSNKLYFKFYYFISATTDKILIKPKGTDSIMSEDESAQCEVVDLHSDYDFTVSAAANFDAQNKYYKQMTGAVIGGKILRGMASAVTTTDTGYLQQVASPLMGSIAAQLSGQIFAKSNYIRAAGKVADTAIDAISYGIQRDIYAKNERAKPSTISLGEDAEIKYIAFSKTATLTEWLPFTDDYNQWINDSKIYGADCVLYKESINLPDFIDTSVNQRIFLSAVCSPREISYLNEVECKELMDILKRGCRFHLYN